MEGAARPAGRRPVPGRSLLEHSFLEELFDFPEFRGMGVIGQAGEKNPAVALPQNAVIQQRKHAAVLAVPDQPAETLLERKDRLGHLVLVKRVAAVFADVPYTGFHDRVARHGKWQAVDDDAPKLFAGHIDSLPETGSCKQHTMGRGPELLEQGRFRRGPLEKSGVLDGERYQIVHLAHLLVACEQHKSAAAALLEDAGDLAGRSPNESRIPRIGQRARHVKKRLFAVIKVARNYELAGRCDAQAFPYEIKFILYGHRR